MVGGEKCLVECKEGNSAICRCRFDSVTRRGMVAEIEKHFENLLHRDNLCIEVSEINKSGLAAVQTCMPFDYSTLKGVSCPVTTLKGTGSSRFRSTSMPHLRRQTGRILNAAWWCPRVM